MLVKGILLASESSRSGLDAPTYAGFAGIMTGFAFAGLAVYLGRQEDTKRRSNSEDPTTADPTAVQVVTALFYAMSSLAICAFLYSSLAGEPDSSRTLVAALIYGPALGSSVLSLFYSMTLMMFEHDVTKKASRYAYRVVVYFGPVVVIRFLTSHSSYSTNQARCNPPDKTAAPSATPTCETINPPWTELTLWLGFILIIILLTSSFLITKQVLPNTKILPKLRDRIAAKPALPSWCAFLLVSIIAILSLFISMVDSNAVLPGWFAYVTLIVGSVLLAIFAFLCGCVLNRRIRIIESADGTSAS